MKITKTDFERLSKPKQKELKDRANKIRENTELPNIWFELTWYMIYFLAFIFLLLPLYKLAWGNEMVIILLNSTSLGLRLFVVGMVIRFIIDFIILLVRVDRLNKLEKDYFKIEVK